MKPRQPMVVVALFFVALLLGFHIIFDEPLPERGHFSLTIEGPSRATIDGFRGEDGVWRRCFERVAYGVDSTLHFEVGDRVRLYTSVRPNGRYIYLSELSIVDVEPSPAPHLPTSMNRWASERLRFIGLSDEDFALLDALLLGNRGALSRERVVSYRRSGMAHLLAVSGLHVGIVVLLLSLLLTPLTLFFWGVELRLWLTIGGVWAYAFLVGMSASVERAAMMISALLLSRLLMRSYSSLNILAFVAVVMLCFDRSLLFDVGFQLSFISVLSIVLCVVPLWRRRPRFMRSMFGDWLLLPLFIGVVCTVATLPLVSYLFGYIPLWGVLLNPLMIFTLSLILGLSCVWLLVGWIGFFAPLFRFVLGFCVEVQNGAVAIFSTGIEYRFSFWGVVVVYCGYVMIYLAFFERFSESKLSHSETELGRSSQNDSAETQ